MSATQPELHSHIRGRRFIDRIVLGGTDGAIEGIALTAALNGAGLIFHTILIAGISFATAGAISMFFSNYLSHEAELESLKVDAEREKLEIETEPEEERRELEELLAKEGYEKAEVDAIMARLATDKDMWLREQLRYELHLDAEALAGGSVTRSAPAGLAFFLVALVPLVPYLSQLGRFAALALSVGSTLVALFLIGSLKLSLQHVNAKAGLKAASIGLLAAVLLYIAGNLISFFAA